MYVNILMYTKFSKNFKKLHKIYEKCKFTRNLCKIKKYNFCKINIKIFVKTLNL